MPVTNYSSFILIVFVILIIFSVHILWSSSICSFLHDLAAGSILFKHSSQHPLSIYVLLSGKNFKYCPNVNNLSFFYSKNIPCTSCLGFKYLVFLLQIKIFSVCKIPVSVSVIPKWWQYDYWSMITLFLTSHWRKDSVNFLDYFLQ
jgi:hypothetical protein